VRQKTFTGVVSFLAALAVSLLASAGDAHAQRMRVVVETFEGHGAKALEEEVLNALKIQRVDSVGKKELAIAEAQLGLLSVSQDYGAVAQAMRVSAFVSGRVEVRQRRNTFEMTVRSASGEVVGSRSWQGRTPRGLVTEVSENIASRLNLILERVPAPAWQNESRRPGRGSVADEEGASADEKAAVASPRSEGEQDDDGGSVFSGMGLGGLDASFGVNFYGRHFTYAAGGAGTPKAYRLPGILVPYQPALTLGADYFFHKALGLSLTGEYWVGVQSKEVSGGMEVVHGTAAYAFSVGAKGRIMLDDTELSGGVAYGKRTFKIVPQGAATPPDVAGVDYNQVQVGAGLRKPAGSKIAVLGSVHYLHLLGMGELQSSKYFPNATGWGAEGALGIGWGLSWLAGLEARTMLQFRRYAFSLNPGEGASRTVDSATDQFLGLLVAVGYRPQ
jgi:hypothetical protein